MPIRTNDIPRIVIERIAGAHPQSVHFGHSEICEWPIGVLREFIQSGLLVDAEHAQTIVCPGCELQCHKGPTLRRDAAGRRRAYISCDEEPRHGRICVPISFLDQYQSNLRTLSRCLAGLVGFENPRSLVSGNAYELGEVKGRHGVRMIGLVIAEAQIDIIIGDHREALLRVLSLSNSGLIADPSIIKRLANRKAKIGHRQRIPDRSQQQTRTRKTQTRDAEIYRRARRLKTSSNSWSDVARSIKETELARKLSFERIRRIISERRGIERGKNRSNR